MFTVCSTQLPVSDSGKSGFALVASISIMAVILLITVSLFSLSSVSTRSATIEAAKTEAQANAKMALMMAIGDLQKLTGSDTRVTANADIIDASAPTLTGVWKSWEGLNHDPGNGRPIAPDYDLKEIHNASTQSRFLSWLVSGEKRDTDNNLVSPFDLVFQEPAPDGSTIPLLSDGSLDDADAREIHVVPTPAEDRSRFAWWVSPENQKARVLQPHQPRSDDITGWAELGQSHTTPDLSILFGENTSVDDTLEPFNSDATTQGVVNRALNRDMFNLLDNNQDPRTRFHDFSTSATGLLTNTATGGWRKDLSLLTEKWDEIYARYPGGELPLFRYAPIPGATSEVPKPTVSDYDPEQSNLYPWSEYSTIIGFKSPGTYYAASASWASLQSFATAYKNFSYGEGSVTSPFVWDKITKRRESHVEEGEHYNHKHKQRIHPQIARFQMLVYARVIQQEDRPDRYDLNLMYVPFFTLWNPFNITLEHTISGTLNGGQGSGTHPNFLGLGFRRSLPGAMAIVDSNRYPDPGAVPKEQYRLLTNGNFQTLDWPSNYANPYDNELNSTEFGGRGTWRDLRTWGCWLPEGTLTFGPGEAKIFSTEPRDTGYAFGGGAFRLKEGYNPSGVTGNNFIAQRNLTLDRRLTFLLRSDRVTQPYRSREPGYGFSLSFGNGSSHFGGTSTVPSGIGDEFHNITALSSISEGYKYWPPDEVDEVTYSVSELASGPWIPIFSMSFGPRMTIGTAPGTTQNRPTKGFVQNNALAAMVLSDPASGDARDHPANNTFDFAYHSLGFGSNVTPNLSDSEGFIATGYQSGDGLSRLIVSEFPLRPMASLLELQSWNPRGNNPYPPFQMNLIGNSDATPLIQQNDIVPPTLEPSGIDNNLMHDDAYCANHLLFDDWFVSSIGPKWDMLSGNATKNIDTYYRDFLSGQDRLTNRAYRVIPEDAELEPSEISSRVDEILNRPDGWLKVASRLLVDGMFNINSTSVDAWKAVLGHGKNRQNIGLQQEFGFGSTTAGNDHAVTRGAVAFDSEAGSDSVVNSHFDGATEYTGFKSLTDDQIEDLAEKIVEQVRERGPFLSLAEFVNRQLSSDEDLALAGAVQTAIINMENDPMANLRNPGNSLSDTTMSPNDSKMDGVDYVFEKAAEGDSAYGAPGWIRQADILRPIAPVLSARDDTFTIRAYGDKLDQEGNVIAEAWCEAVVRRSRNFCDARDAADSIEPPTSPINTAFGRRYEIVNFRWLSPSEV